MEPGDNCILYFSLSFKFSANRVMLKCQMQMKKYKHTSEKQLQSWYKKVQYFYHCYSEPEKINTHGYY